MRFVAASYSNIDDMRNNKQALVSDPHRRLSVFIWT